MKSRNLADLAVLAYPSNPIAGEKCYYCGGMVFAMFVAALGVTVASAGAMAGVLTAEAQEFTWLRRGSWQR